MTTSVKRGIDPKMTNEELAITLISGIIKAETKPSYTVKKYALYPIAEINPDDYIGLQIAAHVRTFDSESLPRLEEAAQTALNNISIVKRELEHMLADFANRRTEEYQRDYPSIDTSPTDIATNQVEKA